MWILSFDRCLGHLYIFLWIVSFFCLFEGVFFFFFGSLDMSHHMYSKYLSRFLLSIVSYCEQKLLILMKTFFLLVLFVLLMFVLLIKKILDCILSSAETRTTFFLAVTTCWLTEGKRRVLNNSPKFSTLERRCINIRVSEF